MGAVVSGIVVKVRLLTAEQEVALTTTVSVVGRWGEEEGWWWWCRAGRHAVRKTA